MKLKQKPEDFSVKESFRFDPAPEGRFRVYLMDKQKVSTFDALERIRLRFGLRPGSFSHCGLKDKQGRTEQLIAVDGADVDLQEPDLRLKYLGRTDQPLSAHNITSNRFSVTVRALSPEEIFKLSASAAEVNRLGVVNYFDSQRFGSLKHGQGFIAKDLIRGDYEAALRNHMAKPSPLDRSEDAKVKSFWQQNWGQWQKKAPFDAGQKYVRIINVLREEPDNFLNAFLQIDQSYRALLLFTFQSYLWNEGVRRLLQLLLPREHLFPMAYQAGTLLFHQDADAQVLSYLRGATFPLLAPDTQFQDDRVAEAAQWALAKQKLALSDLRVKDAPRRLFFKHEERPILVTPHKLVLGKPGPDSLNRGFQKLNVAFTLPPGSYATLVVKRLFHFSWKEDSAEEIAQSQAAFPLRERKLGGELEGQKSRVEAAREGRSVQSEGRPPGKPSRRSSEQVSRPRRSEAAAEVPEVGFRQMQRLKKLEKAARRAAQPTRKK